MNRMSEIEFLRKRYDDTRVGNLYVKALRESVTDLGKIRDDVAASIKAELRKPGIDWRCVREQMGFLGEVIDVLQRAAKEYDLWIRDGWPLPECPPPDDEPTFAPERS